MQNPAATNPSAVEPTPKRFVDDYLPALLAQAHDRISSEFHQVARAHGVSVSEWRVLATLAGGDPVSIGRLAQVTVLKQPTVTRMLDRMTRSGHVERLPHESDRRVTLVRITAAGEQKVKQLMQLARDHERRVLEPFGLQHAENLKAILRRMIELHEGSPAPDLEQET